VLCMCCAMTAIPTCTNKGLAIRTGRNTQNKTVLLIGFLADHFNVRAF